MDEKGYFNVRRYDAKGLSLGARMLYVALCDYANHFNNQEWFFATNATLAEYLGVSEKSLKGYKKELRERDDLVLMQLGHAEVFRSITYYKVLDGRKEQKKDKKTVDENPFNGWNFGEVRLFPNGEEISL